MTRFLVCVAALSVLLGLGVLATVRQDASVPQSAAETPAVQAEPSGGRPADPAPAQDPPPAPQPWLDGDEAEEEPGSDDPEMDPDDPTAQHPVSQLAEGERDRDGGGEQPRLSQGSDPAAPPSLDSTLQPDRGEAVLIAG